MIGFGIWVCENPLIEVEVGICVGEYVDIKLSATIAIPPTNNWTIK